MATSNINEFFTEYLRRRNLRVTPERCEILDAAMKNDEHFDADELYLQLKSQGSKVSRATVYNTLDRLTECGILARYRFGERLARYELIYGFEPHHHMICRSCGRIEEFSDKRVESLAGNAATNAGFAMHDAVLHIYGLCPNCNRNDDD